MLEKRDAEALARALEPLTGNTVAHVVFGLGVLAMAVSTVIVLMLISGLAFAEAARQGWRGRLPTRRVRRRTRGAGSLRLDGRCPRVAGRPDLELRDDAPAPGLLSFVLLLNSKKVMGDQRPEVRAPALNVFLVPTARIVTFASGWTVWMKLGALGLGLLAGLGVAILASLKR